MQSAPLDGEEWNGDAHGEVGLLPKRTFLADEKERREALEFLTLCLLKSRRIYCIAKNELFTGIASQQR